jgi:hypothetical protein
MNIIFVWLKRSHDQYIIEKNEKIQGAIKKKIQSHSLYNYERNTTILRYNNLKFSQEKDVVKTQTTSTKAKTMWKM